MYIIRNVIILSELGYRPRGNKLFLAPDLCSVSHTHRHKIYISVPNTSKPHPHHLDSPSLLTVTIELPPPTIAALATVAHHRGPPPSHIQQKGNQMMDKANNAAQSAKESLQEDINAS
ncbi:uncharacterized protein LOC114308025 [Camellia sinensis]|uniref:uncharacterized protein LOC114308025 n=1 Tax=Camellia sinensis TaxID=4442 RepID=UPI0010368D6E|nr:uncharacterized protein LOC114308025 [Camellia sinensis]